MNSNENFKKLEDLLEISSKIFFGEFNVEIINNSLRPIQCSQNLLLEFSQFISRFLNM